MLRIFYQNISHQVLEHKYVISTFGPVIFQDGVIKKRLSLKPLFRLTSHPAR
jgi:hypothetical protein